MIFESEPMDSNWLVAMKKELKAIENNRIRSDTKAKLIYKLKLRPNGEISKYKEKLVARGFLQNLGIDLNEYYAPVAWLETIRI